MLEIEFTEAAEQDLGQAWEWYENEVAGLGDRFAEEVQHQLARVSENYRQFNFIWRDARRARCRGFPYGIIFRERSRRIYVIAVFHYSRNPGTWRRRF